VLLRFAALTGYSCTPYSLPLEPGAPFGRTDQLPGCGRFHHAFRDKHVSQHTGDEQDAKQQPVAGHRLERQSTRRGCNTVVRLLERAGPS
jgi:hypothetical protein